METSFVRWEEVPVASDREGAGKGSAAAQSQSAERSEASEEA